MAMSTSRLTTRSMLRLLLLLFPCVIPSVSSSNQNYNAYNYDMTTPQFTPDGRLLQVEYASKAATHSSPCVIWKPPQGTDDEITLIMTAKSSRKIQNRLIPLSETTAVCLSGVVSDSLALLSKVYEVQDNNRRLYGSALTELQIANSIAISCQRHSFGGGLRPYGSTMVIVSPKGILQTDPSGAVLTVNTDAKLHVVGGSTSSAEELRRTTQLLLLQQHQRAETPETTLANALLALAKAVLETSLGENDPLDNAWLEVMVVSKKQGIHKLTNDQIERLLAKVRE
jgi:20S proteasome alpha/beta subunit